MVCNVALSFDVEAERRTDLSVALNSGEKAEVQGVVGTSEDGSYVYFAADGVLTTGENTEAKAPVAGQPNLYLSHDGKTTFIATLSAKDGEGVEPLESDCGHGGICTGDWQVAPGYKTAEVTPDGQSLVFMSNQSLTGYNNATGLGSEGGPLYEVFLFDTRSEKLRCISCNPSGEPPVPTEFNTHYQDIGIGGFIPFSHEVRGEQPRVISANGNQVFFDSGEPLLPTATNGWLDVYEWERAGTPEGSCPEGAPGGGCVYLLSSGTDPEPSYLLGTDASGDNAFFLSRAQLVSQDRGSNDYEIYDARVDGGQAPAKPACEGTGCQGVPPTPPIFATPSSVTFNGIGNFPQPVPTVVKPTSKTVKCKKGFTKKKNKCVKTKHKKKSKAKKAKRASNERRVSR